MFSLMNKLKQMLRHEGQPWKHVVADRFVGSLFHCLSIAGKNEW